MRRVCILKQLKTTKLSCLSNKEVSHFCNVSFEAHFFLSQHLAAVFHLASSEGLRLGVRFHTKVELSHSQSYILLRVDHSLLVVLLLGLCNLLPELVSTFLHVGPTPCLFAGCHILAAISLSAVSGFRCDQRHDQRKNDNFHIINQMRPQTSEAIVRDFEMLARPQSSKLMTQSQIRNLSARQFQKQVEFLAKPPVEIQYNRFVARNFGVLCDKEYFDQSKQTQLQKFGRAQNQASKIVQKSKLPTAPVKKVQIYKLRDMDARQRADPESITEREKELQFRKMVQAIMADNINPIKDLMRTYNKNDLPLIVKLTPMLIRKRRRAKKPESQVALNWTITKKLLLIADLQQYVEDNLIYESKRTFLETNRITHYDIINEEMKPKDFDVLKEQRKFQIIMPKLVIYCDDINKNASINLTNWKMANLINSNFELIHEYVRDASNQNNEIEVLSNQVMPHQSFKVSLQPGTLTLKEKIIKKILFQQSSYYQLSLIPPCIKIFQGDRVSGAYCFTLQDFRSLAAYTSKKTIQEFLSNQLKVVQINNNRTSVMLHLADFEAQTVVDCSTCAENGLLLERTVDSSIRYLPPRFEFYNPVTSEKIDRVMLLEELLQIVQLGFQFSL